MTDPVVLLATCAEVPELDEDARCLQRALTRRGVDARAAVWTDDGVDWAHADLVMVRSTWDYARRRDRYLAWAATVASETPLHNPADLLAWTTDKTYLRDLAAVGVPVVPTCFLSPEDGTEHPYLDVEHVVKPAVSAGSKDTHRLGPEDADRSRAEARSIHASGRIVMVQPYLAAVDTTGETALVFLDGRFSHALRKGPLLQRGAGPVQGLFAEEDMSLREPSPQELAVAERALAAVPGDEPPLYARVDLLPTDEGPRLLELELAEPSLFLDLVDGAADRVADAVLARLGATPQTGR